MWTQPTLFLAILIVLCCALGQTSASSLRRAQESQEQLAPSRYLQDQGQEEALGKNETDHDHDKDHGHEGLEDHDDEEDHDGEEEDHVDVEGVEQGIEEDHDHEGEGLVEDHDHEGPEEDHEEGLEEDHDHKEGLVTDEGDGDHEGEHLEGDDHDHEGEEQGLEEEDHDHEHDGEGEHFEGDGHDHGEDVQALEDDHDHDGDHDHEGDDHDHQDEAQEELVGDGHDHDVHEGHDHDDHEGHDHDDHEGHDHGTATSSSEVSEDDSKPWGQAIGAAILVNCATFIGLFVLAPIMLLKKGKNPHRRLLFNIIPSFGVGALMATAVFLILPESILLIAQETGASEHAHRMLRESNPESEAAWKFGACLLGGFLLPLIMGSIFPHANHDVPGECPECVQRRESMVTAVVLRDKDTSGWLHAVEESEEEEDVCVGCDDENCVSCNRDRSKTIASTMASSHSENCSICGHTDDDEEGGNVTTRTTSTIPAVEKPITTKPEREVNKRLAASLLLGDFFHNFADGIFIGTAFNLCDRRVAWVITATTIFHELAQELADFFLLTAHAGLSIRMALLLNFVSGFSVLFGVIIMLAANVSNMATGCILAISAGVYFNIAASECLPRIDKELKVFLDRALSILFFIIGAVPIGLVLLNHGHCEAE